MKLRKPFKVFLGTFLFCVLLMTGCAKNLGDRDSIHSLTANIPSKSSCSNSSLSANQYLYAGQAINSCDGRFYLIMQGDGNLVLYQQGKALWASNTSGNSGAFAVMQGDGNLVIYKDSRAIWATGTNSYPGAYLVLQDDANLVIYKDGTSKWATMTFSASLESGQIMKPFIEISSLNRLLKLIMQGDGNLVLYFEGKPIWASNTGGNPGAYAVMQSDGNLVIYNSSRAIWASGTNGNSGAFLSIQDDGNLAVLKGTSIKWNSNTSISVLKGGQGLNVNEKLYSKNRQYTLVMQGDGNLVMYKENKACWATGTGTQSGATAAMQTDGNFVLYRSSTAIWNSGTNGNSGAYIAMQDDGNLVIYKDGNAKWASGSAGACGASTTDNYQEFFTDNSFNAHFTGPFPSGDVVERWRPLALKALRMLGEDTSVIDVMMHRIYMETTGDPNAINLWDANAMRGTPSKGLLQCIDSTFKTYAIPPYDKHIYSPLGNMLASLRYAKAAYGSVRKAYTQPGGY